MHPPKLPPDENARLADLQSIYVLDTPTEKGLDRLTGGVAKLLDVPIALVSLVDADRQWFKSRHGLAATQTPRDISFCGHVVADGEPLLVSDASADERFHDNPLVTGELQLRFYYGVPLRSPAGHVLGTLCAIDSRPRQLTAHQREAMELLAGAAADQLELIRQRWQLHSEREAARLQQARLAASEAQLRALFAAMAEGVVLQDHTGTIVAANPAAESILGLSQDELMGRTSRDPRWRSTHPDGTPFPGQDHPSMRTLRTAQPQRDVPMTIHLPSGERRRLRISSHPLAPLVDGRPTAVVVTFTDVTQQIAAEQALQMSEARLARIVAGASDGAFEFDYCEQVATRSPRLAEMLGRSVEELGTKPEFHRFILEADRALLDQDVEALRQGLMTALDREVRAQAADGSLKWLHIRASLVAGPRGEGQFLSGTVSDVTERHLAAVQLMEISQRNEKLVRELTEALNKVKTLSGLLPICMYCKNVRDDAGYWKRIEQYIAARTDAQFSHGMCPACYLKHHGPEE